MTPEVRRIEIDEMEDPMTETISATMTWTLPDDGLPFVAAGCTDNGPYVLCYPRPGGAISLDGSWDALEAFAAQLVAVVAVAREKHEAPALSDMATVALLDAIHGDVAEWVAVEPPEDDEDEQDPDDEEDYPREGEGPDEARDTRGGWKATPLGGLREFVSPT